MIRDLTSNFLRQKPHHDFLWAITVFMVPYGVEAWGNCHRRPQKSISEQEETRLVSQWTSMFLTPRKQRNVPLCYSGTGTKAFFVFAYWCCFLTQQNGMKNVWYTMHPGMWQCQHESLSHFRWLSIFHLNYSELKKSLFVSKWTAFVHIFFSLSSTPTVHSCSYRKSCMNDLQNRLHLWWKLYRYI